MQYTLAEQRKTSFPIALPFNQFQLGHVTFDHPVIDRPGKAISHCVFVFLNPSGKELEFWKSTLSNRFLSRW